MTLSESRIFFIFSVLEKLPTIVSTHFLCLKKIIITTIRITKYPGNYKETTRKLQGIYHLAERLLACTLQITPSPTLTSISMITLCNAPVQYSPEYERQLILLTMAYKGQSLQHKPLRPDQTHATFQSNILQHCCTQRVVHVGHPITSRVTTCSMLDSVGSSLKIVKYLFLHFWMLQDVAHVCTAPSQHLTRVALKCCVHLTFRPSFRFS